MNAAATIGTLSKKTEAHEKSCRSSPPTTGPRPIPTEAVADQIAIALARSSRGKMLLTVERVAGMIIAPPTPISARSATNWPEFCANAARTLAPPNTTRPSWSARLRPKWSPSVPITSSRPANASV
jgi:hypothetical protein